MLASSGTLPNSDWPALGTVPRKRLFPFVISRAARALRFGPRPRTYERPPFADSNALRGRNRRCGRPVMAIRCYCGPGTSKHDSAKKYPNRERTWMRFCLQLTRERSHTCGTFGQQQECSSGSSKSPHQDRGTGSTSFKTRIEETCLRVSQVSSHFQIFRFRVGLAVSPAQVAVSVEI